MIAEPLRSPGDCTCNRQTPTSRWVSDWDAANAVILVIGTTRIDRLTRPLRSRSTPLITEYFLTCHWAVAMTMISAKRMALTHHGAPPRIVTTRNGIAERRVFAVSMIR